MAEKNDVRVLLVGINLLVNQQTKETCKWEGSSCNKDNNGADSPMADKKRKRDIHSLEKRSMPFFFFFLLSIATALLFRQSTLREVRGGV